MKIECLSDDEQHEPTAGVCAVPHLLICLDDRCCRVVVMVAVCESNNNIQLARKLTLCFIHRITDTRRVACGCSTKQDSNRTTTT